MKFTLSGKKSFTSLFGANFISMLLASDSEFKLGMLQTNIFSLSSNEYSEFSIELIFGLELSPE